MTGLFVTGTGTGVGKTKIACALTRALASRGVAVAAIKPIETGALNEASDAEALAVACGRPELATDPAWYRARPPLSPYAAALEGELPVQLTPIVSRLRAIEELAIIEGAGGLLVPLDRDRTIADLAAALALPLLIVAPDRLGTLSDTLAILEAAGRRQLKIAAVALNRLGDELDPSTRSNARILRERSPAPVVIVERGANVEPLLAIVTNALGI